MPGSGQSRLCKCIDKERGQGSRKRGFFSGTAAADGGVVLVPKSVGTYRLASLDQWKSERERVPHVQQSV